MNRRRFLAVLATPVIAPLLDACSSDDGGDGGDGGDLGEARADIARDVADPTDIGSLPASWDLFGMDAYRALAGANTGNLVVSPLSIAAALSMAAAGARGDTLDELLSALHVDDAAELHHLANALTAELDRRSGGDVVLSVSNSLWAQSGMDIESPFLDTLAREYGAGLQLVDFREDAEGARERINGWVDDETAGRIPELLAPQVLGPDTRFTVVNAVYVKAPWALPFEQDLTDEGTFTTSNDDPVRVPMMHMTAELAYASGDGWQAVQLDYAGGDLALLVYQPEEGFLADFEQVFMWDDAVPYLQWRRVSLTMPRFDIGASLQLADVLRSIGIRTAFTDGADFSGLTTDEPLHIGDVIHQANITVDEAGTEAAAATAIEIAAGASPDEQDPIEFRCDHPFVFVLRDVRTDTVLFLGRVGVPARAELRPAAASANDRRG